MNRWPGVVLRVEREEGLARVACGHGADVLYALVVDDGAGWIRPGREVDLLFKETEVIVSPPGTAPWPGAFRAVVAAIEAGQILTALSLERGGDPLRALLDSAVVGALGLRPGAEVDVWIPPASLALEDRAA